MDCRKCDHNKCPGYAVAGYGMCPDKDGNETDCNVCSNGYILKCKETCKKNDENEVCPECGSVDCDCGRFEHGCC